jgi:hypothetical protein
MQEIVLCSYQRKVVLRNIKTGEGTARYWKKIIDQRLATEVDQRLGDKHAQFGAGGRTLEQINARAGHKIKRQLMMFFKFTSEIALTSGILTLLKIMKQYVKQDKFVKLFYYLLDNSDYAFITVSGASEWFKIKSGAKQGLIDWLFAVLCPAQEFFTYMETSPLLVKGCKI